MEQSQDTVADTGAAGRRTFDPDVRLSVLTGLMIAAGFLFLLFFAAIKHDSIADAGGVIASAALGFVCGLATIITGQVLKTPVRHWVQAGIGAIVLILSVSLSWHGAIAVGDFGALGNFIQQAFQQAAQQFNPYFVPLELFILYGAGSGAWACVFVLMVVALGCLEARRRVPDSALIRYVLGGVVGIAWTACLVQLLVWLAQSGSDSPVWIFRSHDVVLIIYTIVAVLGVLAILSVELAASVSIIPSNIERLARFGLELAWVPIWLAIGVNVLHFLMGLSGGATGWLVVMFVVGLVTGFAPLLAASILAISGIRSTLVGVAAYATTSVGQPPPRPAPVVHRPPGPMPPLAVAQQPGPRVPPVMAPHGSAKVEPAPSPKLATDNIEDQLRKLKAWQEKGLITEGEYQGKKRELLGRL